MELQRISLTGAALVRFPRFGDARGWFSETFRADLLAQEGIAGPFIQDNSAFSGPTHVLRGLHFQAPPFVQAKLLRVVRGRILDVLVDLRSASPTYGAHEAIEIDAAGGWQIYVPGGFAHGYLTLEPDTEVQYKVTAPHAPAAERGLRWDDPALAIAWPVTDGLTISPRDHAWPDLAAQAIPAMA